MKKILFILPILLLMTTRPFAQIPTYLPTYGLCAWFPFTGNANDSSGHGHNGTPYATANATGRYGIPNTAFYFNGTSSYVYVPPGTPSVDMSTDITGSLTISAWVKSQNYFMSSQEQIYWRGDPTPAHDPHMLYFNGGQIRIRRDVDPGTVSNEVGTSVSGLDTNFHLLTGTYDSATSLMCIYVDGVLINSAVLYGLETYPTSTMYNYIGAVDGGTWQFFYGIIDELAIWNRALTPCEVAALYYSVPNIIVTQPKNDTVAYGGSAAFYVSDVFSSSTYQWQADTGSGFVNLPNAAPYAGVYTPTLTISPATSSMSGRHFRCVPKSGTCLTDTTNAAMLTVLLPSSVSNVPVESSLTVIPNPNRGTFTITGTCAVNEIIAIDITDLTGKTVYFHKIFSADGHIDENISLDNRLTPGLYLLKLNSRGQNKTLPIMIGD